MKSKIAEQVYEEMIPQPFYDKIIAAMKYHASQLSEERSVGFKEWCDANVIESPYVKNKWAYKNGLYTTKELYQEYLAYLESLKTEKDDNDQIAQDATQQWLTGFLTEGLAKGIIAYGKQQYNNAIDDAAEKASTMIETRTDGYDTWDVYTVDKQSILTLKK